MWYDGGGVWYRCESRARPPPEHIVLLCTAVCLCVRARTHGLATWRAGPAWTHTHRDVLESLGRWANSAAGPPPWSRFGVRREGARLLVMLGIRTADRADQTFGFLFLYDFSADYSSFSPLRNGNFEFFYIPSSSQCFSCSMAGRSFVAWLERGGVVRKYSGLTRLRRCIRKFKTIIIIYNIIIFNNIIVYAVLKSQRSTNLYTFYPACYLFIIIVCIVHL